MRKVAFTGFALFLFLPSNLWSQDAVPIDILQRTVFIKVGSEAGTAFAVDYQGKMYLITAKHVVAGVPAENATIQIWQDNEWKNYQTVKTIYPSSGDVDIAVFATQEKVDKPYLVTVGGLSGGPTLGQQVWFLGYPWGIASHFGGGKVAPFIKRGTMSAVDSTNPNAVVLYVDGFNNPGFSGGPIVFWNFSTHSYQIIGVVKGYREDSAKVLINGQHVDTQLLVNTGILVGYSIEHAMKAIQEAETQAASPK
jgi:hypothetical protein